LEFARNEGLSYLLKHPKFDDCIDRLSFILVGSSATGLCRPDSDVDIAIVCEKELYDKISKETRWSERRPSVEIINEIQLHYYANSFEAIEEKINQLDDLYLYVYSNCIILQDANNQYVNRIQSKDSRNEKIRRARIEGKLDMLLRRSKILKLCIENKEDILAITEICFEVIKLSLKVTALLDNIDFEPRKRLFITALSGKTGHVVEDMIRQLFYTIGLIGTSKENMNFPNELTEIINVLSREAQRQGFMAGMERPDIRHLES
jgi:predicted nucleotidyltransferase